MHMTYTADLVEKEFLSKKVQDLIRQKADVKSQKEAFILELETHKKELEKEKETIYDSASFFGVFLKENAMIQRLLQWVPGHADQGRRGKGGPD